MTVFTATERRAHLLAAASHGGAYGKKNLTATIELAAQATFPHTIEFGHIPSNARIASGSKVYWDKLATATTTLDLGLGAFDGNLVNADDPDALNVTLDVTSAGSADLLADHANFGLPAWDLVASETTDPGGELKVYGTVQDALTTGTGTITVSVDYYID